MLSALHIENIAVIKELNLDFSSGFSVMTGETGAGKSIIIGSVRLLMGARADKDMVRAGEEKALVEGLFSDIDQVTASALKELSVAPDENGELLLSRTLTVEGKSTCKINRKTVPLSLLKAAGGLLIAIHGQHDTQTLLNEETHLPLLDRYGECGEQFEKYKMEYERSVALKSRLTALMKEDAQREEQREKYSRACMEISEAALQEGEEELLENRKRIVKNAQKLAKQARIVYRALYKNEKGGSAGDLMEIAVAALEQLSEALPESEEYISKLTAYRLELEEIAKGALSVAEIGTDNPTQELNRIEDRLDLIRALKKRYGGSEKEVLAYGQKAEEMLWSLNGRDAELKKLREELENAVMSARREGALLGRYRQKAAEQLEKAVNGQLGFLDLEKVLFRVEVLEEQNSAGAPRLTGTGMNSVRFLIVSNPGEPFKPIADIASGGELSRIMLALKVALADKESTPSLIFDEIDTGISGKTSQKIGIKLREIAAYAQVFCITHSAQVAACGHSHYRIYKTETGGRNQTEVCLLDSEGRVEELSRIMGGIHISEAVREGAKELLADGQK